MKSVVGLQFDLSSTTSWSCELFCQLCEVGCLRHCLTPPPPRRDPCRTAADAATIHRHVHWCTRLKSRPCQKKITLSKSKPGKVPTTPFHSDDANDANCISCITTPQKSPPTQPQKTFPPRTLLPQHVPSLRVPFAGHPPRPPNYSLRSPNTTPLAPSTKAGFRKRQTQGPPMKKNPFLQDQSQSTIPTPDCNTFC